MRRILMAAGLVACLGLAACEGQVSQAEAETPAPEKKKSLARPAQMYAGQEQILSVESGTVAPSPNGGVIITAKGATASAGWSDAAFLPRIYAATPPDGIYEVDLIATKPTGAAAEVVTPVEIKGEWNRYTDGRVKGVRFITKTNEVTAMLAPSSAAAE